MGVSSADRRQRRRRPRIDEWRGHTLTVRGLSTRACCRVSAPTEHTVPAEARGTAGLGSLSARTVSAADPRTSTARRKGAGGEARRQTALRRRSR